MSGVSDESKKVSELEQVSSLLDDDYLVFQKDNHSYKLKFADFKQYVLDNISSYMGLSSMAFHDIEEFAPFAHKHDYTDMWFFPSYGPGSGNAAYIDPLCCTYCGKFNVTRHYPGQDAKKNYEISVCTPLPKDPSVVKPQNIYSVGDTVLFAPKDAKVFIEEILKQKIADGNIDIHDPDFSGFVVPNGQTFTCQPNEFTKACKMYSSTKDENATSFTVPDLNGLFFKSLPGSQYGSPLSVVPGHTALLEHTHLAQSTEDNSTQVTFKSNGFTIRVSGVLSDLKNKMQFVHAGKKNTNINGSVAVIVDGLSFNDQLKINQITCGEAGDDDATKSYPSYANLLMLLYIGER